MKAKRFKLVPEMEDGMARWYARQRSSPVQMEGWRKQAAQLVAGLYAGARVLEVAPGPGFLAIEIARGGKVQVTGLDISRTFVEIAAENAWRAGVDVEFCLGDVAGMPFEAESFDLIVCQAAFKNFIRPATALEEMYRVLRPGGVAVIEDLSREASKADIAEEVRRQGLRGFDAFVTRWILGTMLRRRAYTAAQLEQLAAGSPFGTGEVQKEGIGFRLRLTRPGRQKAGGHAFAHAG